MLEEIRAPRLASVQRPDGSFVSKPLEDLAPFLDRAEFLENMIVPPLPE
jgi:acetolactate synthase-1/2/3 large subunit